MIPWLLHIWFLVVMPIIAIVKIIANENIYKPMQKIIPEYLVLIVMIAGIVGMFFIFANGLLIGNVYSDIADESIKSNKKIFKKYIFMVLSPFVYFLIIHFIVPKELINELVETGIIALVSQHFMLQFTLLFFMNPKTSLLGKIYYIFSFLLFLIISSYIVFVHIIFTDSIFWNGVFLFFLSTSLLSSFHFYYSNRKNFWKEISGSN